MLDIEEVRQWMEDAPEIKPDQLTEQDILNTREAVDAYKSWKYDGGRRSIEDYWNDPRPLHERLPAFKRGFEVWARYKLIESTRSIIAPETLRGLNIEMVVPAGHIATSEAWRRVGLKRRLEHHVID